MIDDPFQESLIEEAFGSPAKIRVLRLLNKPGAGYMSTSQLSKLTDLNVMTLSRALESLQEIGVVSYILGGKSKLWRLSERYSAKLILPLLDAFEKLPNPVERLKEIISSVEMPPDIERIILFGSVSRNQGDMESDIDLCLQLQGKKVAEDIESFQCQLSEKIFNDFGMNPSFLIKNQKEWAVTSKKLKENIQQGVILYEKNKST